MPSSPSPSPSPSQSPPEQQPQPTSPQTSPSKTLPIKTHHCRYCNHLLLATTRHIPSLPTRSAPAQDHALILPLLSPSTTTTTTTAQPQPSEQEKDAGPGQKQTHYTILLSTTIPDRKPSLIRREDGFEKRLFLRCGRCRVVMGYFLDPVHFSSSGERTRGVEGEEEVGEEEEEEEEEEGAKVVYLLPGAVVETGSLDDEEVRKKLDGEWSGWFTE